MEIIWICLVSASWDWLSFSLLILVITWVLWTSELIQSAELSYQADIKLTFGGYTSD